MCSAMANLASVVSVKIQSCFTKYEEESSRRKKCAFAAPACRALTVVECAVAMLAQPEAQVVSLAAHHASRVASPSRALDTPRLPCHAQPCRCASADSSPSVGTQPS